MLRPVLVKLWAATGDECLQHFQKVFVPMITITYAGLSPGVPKHHLPIVTPAVTWQMWHCLFSSQTHLLPGNLDFHTKKNADHDMCFFTTQKCAEQNQYSWSTRCMRIQTMYILPPLSRTNSINWWSLLKSKTCSIVLHILASATLHWNVYTLLLTGPSPVLGVAPSLCASWPGLEGMKIVALHNLELYTPAPR